MWCNSSAIRATYMHCGFVFRLVPYWLLLAWSIDGFWGPSRRFWDSKSLLVSGRVNRRHHDRRKYTCGRESQRPCESLYRMAAIRNCCEGKMLFLSSKSWDKAYVWIKLHCIVSRSKQCTSQENWSITSSKPPKRYILLPTMHALWPSRAPGKFPLTSGVSHSRVCVSKQKRISHTWTKSAKVLIAKCIKTHCITHHLIVPTAENVHLTFVCNSRVPYNGFSYFILAKRKIEEKNRNRKNWNWKFFLFWSGFWITQKNSFSAWLQTCGATK